jgi:hypothetical protein
MNKQSKMHRVALFDRDHELLKKLKSKTDRSLAYLVSVAINNFAKSLEKEYGEGKIKLDKLSV